MRHDAPFVVKRFAPMIGRPESGRRIAIEYHAYTLAEALEAATSPARRLAHLRAERLKYEGDGRPWMASTIRELEHTATWIERRGHPATIRKGGGGAP